METFADYNIDIKGRATGQVKTKCPQCSHTRKNHSDPCLSVDLDNGLANCHHAGCEFKVNLNYKPNEFKPKKIYKSPSPKYIKPTNKLEKYLISRKISLATLKKNKIGYSNQYFNKLEANADCIAFPFFENGELIYLKYRALPKDHTADPGCRPILYGLDFLPAELPVLIWVEGELDKLSVDETELPCVSVPNGANVGQMEYLEYSVDLIEKVPKHIIAVDNDAAGYNLKQELIRRIGPERCLQIEYPEGCKDANDILMEYGKDRLRKILEYAQSVPIEGIYKARDLSEKIHNRYFNPAGPGKSTGWYELDRYYTVEPGQITIVTGVPSHGKSEFLDALCVNLAKGHGWKFAYFSPENFPIEDHIVRLMRKFIGKPYGKGYTGTMNINEAKEATQWADKHFSFFNSPDITFSINQILDMAKKTIVRDGINGLIIDPWNEVEHTRPANITGTEHISKCLTAIRKFARHNRIHIWVVVHPIKRHKDERKIPPSLYDCEGSAHWYNKTDNGITVFREDVTDDNSPTKILITKIKFRNIGKPGEIELTYNKASGRYKE